MSETPDFTAALDGMRRDGKIPSITAAALTQFQPTTGLVPIPGGITFQQNDFIGDTLLPLITMTASEHGFYKVFDKARFLVLRDAAGVGLADVVGINGEHLRADLSFTTVGVDLQVHGYSAWIDDRERKEAANLNYNVEDGKAQLIKTMIETGRESDAAALIRATSSYASATYYSTLSGSTLWSASTGVPLVDIPAKIEVLRGATGTRNNIVLWLSPKAFNALRFHASILAIVNGGATRTNPALPIGTELLSAIFGVPVVVGYAVESTTVGGAVADVWGAAAGLLMAGPANMDAPKFGATLVSAGYPTSRVERNPHLGAKGIDVLYYDDAYKHIVQLNTAGYLWTTAA
jgi:hypothetical protein